MHKTQHWGGQRSCLCRSGEKSTEKSVVSFNFNENLRTQDEIYWNSTTCLAYIKPSLLFLAVNEWMNKWMKEIFTFEPCKCIGKKKWCAIWPLSKIQGKKIENWVSNPSFNHRFDEQSFPGLFSSWSDQSRGQRNDREDSTSIVQEWGLDYIYSQETEKARWEGQCSGSRGGVPRARWLARLAELLSSWFSETPRLLYIHSNTKAHTHGYIHMQIF